MSSENKYVYIRSEPTLWTVGFYNDGKWEAESDHDNTEAAAHRAHYLNGGSDAALVAEVRKLREKKLTLTIRAERCDDMPAFGAFLRCDCPKPNEPAVIFINVESCLSPTLLDDDQNEIPMSRDERKQLLITTLMHEFGHALEAHFNIPKNEAAIEQACEQWERKSEVKS